MTRTAAMILALVFLAGCSGTSPGTVPPDNAGDSGTATRLPSAPPTAPQRWVTRHSGRVGADGTGWLATKATWRGPWPWPSPNVVVACTYTYGGASYVNLTNGKNYYFTVTRPVPGQTYFAGAAMDISTDEVAAEAWAQRADQMCGLA